MTNDDPDVELPVESDDWRERLDAHTPRTVEELDALAAELRAEREEREAGER